MKNNSSLWIILYRMRLPFIVIIITYTIAITGLLMIEGVDDKGQPYSMTIFDAFYFITYTATTIGFGETPYAFTYTQKLWVSASIYITVLGWFYGIGTLVSLLQNKLFSQEIAKARFRRAVRNIKEKFIIILGYNQITSEIIKKAIDEGLRPVVIEKDENRANDLILENFTPSVPILLADVSNSKALEDAGIQLHNCKAIVSLFESETLNFRVALTSKLLNKNVTLAIKSTTKNHTENLQDLGVEIITDPFETIASEIDMAINAPNLLKLEKWIYGIGALNTALPKFPSGKYIVCGYGRMGYDIFKVLENNAMEAEFIEMNEQAAKNFHDDMKRHIIVANADDKEVLTQAGIHDAVGIIAATNNDTTNLSILTTARKLKKDIITIARENELDDFSIFANADINHIFVPSNILIHKTTNALINPLSEIFIQKLPQQNEQWAAKLVRQLIEVIDESPLMFEMDINYHDANEITYQLNKKHEISLGLLRVSLRNRELKNNVIPLLLIRDNEVMLLPSWDVQLQKNDRILFACDSYAKHDMEYIAQNKYEFHYAYTGFEKRTILTKLFEPKTSL